MIISEINSYLVKYKKEITTTGVGVIQTLCTKNMTTNKILDYERYN